MIIVVIKLAGEVRKGEVGDIDIRRVIGATRATGTGRGKAKIRIEIEIEIEKEIGKRTR